MERRITIIENMNHCTFQTDDYKEACNYLASLMNISDPVVTYYHKKETKPFELPEKDKNYNLYIGI